MVFLNMRKQVLKSIRRWKFAHSVRSSDVFLVTYPKSGTTWLGFLIANILHGMQSPPLNLRTYLDYVPDINAMYFDNNDLSKFSNMPNPRFFSTHAPYDPTFPRVIYVMRDPRDVMVSYWRHTKLMNPSSDISLDEFILSDNHWPCHWSEHVRGWVLEGHKNIFVMKYEDMMVDAFSIAKKMLEFINYSVDEKALEHAIEESKFENMKSLEEKYGIGRPETKLKGFVRKGKSGSWRDEISSGVLVCLEKEYGPVMKAVGYETVTI